MIAHIVRYELYLLEAKISKKSHVHVEIESEGETLQGLMEKGWVGVYRGRS